MADLAREDGVEPETEKIGWESSPTVLERGDRLGCSHVAAGASVAGFTSIQVHDPSSSIAGSNWDTKLVDLCAECYELAKLNLFVGLGHDRRRERRPTRPPSSVAEQPADNRQVAAKTTDDEPTSVGEASAVEASGSIPAVGSIHSISVIAKSGRLVQPWDEHLISEGDDR